MLGLTSSYAHAIWIETSSEGVAGKPQEIKIYFGEFATEDISAASAWYGDLSQFDLKWVKPTGEITRLPLKANGDHFVSSITPNGQGRHQLLLEKTASEISYGYKLSFMASATISVGQPTKKAAPLLPISVETETLKGTVGKAFYLQYHKADSLKGDQEITVVSPNSWTKKLYADDKGSAHFTPLWPGKYLIETTLTDKNKGAYKGQDYEVAFYCHTYVVEIE